MWGRRDQTSTYGASGFRLCRSRRPFKGLVRFDIPGGPGKSLGDADSSLSRVARTHASTRDVRTLLDGLEPREEEFGTLRGCGPTETLLPRRSRFTPSSGRVETFPLTRARCHSMCLPSLGGEREGEKEREKEREPARRRCVHRRVSANGRPGRRTGSAPSRIFGQVADTRHGHAPRVNRREEGGRRDVAEEGGGGASTTLCTKICGRSFLNRRRCKGGKKPRRDATRGRKRTARTSPSRSASLARARDLAVFFSRLTDDAAASRRNASYSRRAPAHSLTTPDGGHYGNESSRRVRERHRSAGARVGALPPPAAHPHRARITRSICRSTRDGKRAVFKYVRASRIPSEPHTETSPECVV